MTSYSNEHLINTTFRLYGRRTDPKDGTADRRTVPDGLHQGPIHLSIGQEAVSVVMRCSSKYGWSGYYRGHALYLSKGGDLKAMMAELFGKIDGCAWKGRLYASRRYRSEGNWNAAVVAGNIPVALGYALTEKLRGRDNIIVCFMGDGATEGCVL